MVTKREVFLARHLRRNATPSEREAWELLRDRRCEGVKFKRQQPLGDFIVDFYCPELGLIIEIDGGIHREPEQAAKDEIRTAELESLGMTVVRVLNRDVGANTFSRIILGHKALPLSVHKDGEGAGG